MKSWFRDNPMIAVSVAMPVLVIVAFALAQLVPRLYVAPPMHNLLLVMDGAGNADAELPVKVEIAVADGKLVAVTHAIDELPGGYRPPAYKPHLLEYVAAEDTVREIEIELPRNLEALPEGAEVAIPALSGARLATTLRSPDGYDLELSPDSGGGVFRGLFGGYRARSPRLVKDGRVVSLDLPSTGRYYYYGGLRFVGWVIDGEPE